MRAAAEGEYADFVTHHADRLCRAAYLLCGDWARAEDATQEALLKLYRSWPRESGLKKSESAVGSGR